MLRHKHKSPGHYYTAVLSKPNHKRSIYHKLSLQRLGKGEKKAGLAAFLAKYPTVADAEAHVTSELNSATDLEALKTKLNGILSELIKILYLIAK